MTDELDVLGSPMMVASLEEDPGGRRRRMSAERVGVRRAHRTTSQGTLRPCVEVFACDFAGDAGIVVVGRGLGPLASGWRMDLA
jgi:hypothetical protein